MLIYANDHKDVSESLDSIVFADDTNGMVGNKDTERKSSIKFLRVMLNEHISWIVHIGTFENKIAENIDLFIACTSFLMNSTKNFPWKKNSK